jgi:hypothetical protein
LTVLPEHLSFSGYFFAAALFASHIFLVAAMIAALPAALSFRFGFGAAFEVGVAVGVADAWDSGLPFIAARVAACQIVSV